MNDRQSRKQEGKRQLNLSLNRVTLLFFQNLKASHVTLIGRNINILPLHCIVLACYLKLLYLVINLK